VGRVPPVVEARQARRGVPWTVAVPMGAAIGAVPRCERPRARRQGWGRRPAADAPGAQRRQGALTQAGNTPARRALRAGAWAYRSPATGSRPRPRRLAPPPTGIQDSSGQAQGRRWRRSRRLGARGTHAHVVTGAMARARAGGRGALAHQVPGTPSGPRSPPDWTPHAAGFRRAAAKTPPRCGVTRGGVQRRGEGYAGRDGGRPPTEAGKVGPNPRIAAGATVVASWLRRCRCPEVKQTV
jgi:hypothetical protein